MTKSIKMKCLPRLLDKITNVNTSNNAEFDYYGYHVTMLSGTVDYTNVYIQNKRKHTILHFTIDFWTKECEIEYYEDYNLRDSLVKSLNELYDYTMRFSDPAIDEELARLEPLLGDEEYVQEIVQKEYDELVKHKID